MTLHRANDPTPASTPEPAEPGPGFEPPSVADEAEDVHHPVDRVVFGVAAAITVAFIAWGCSAPRR